MEGEDLRAATLAHGTCDVPVRDGRSCEQVRGRCTVHTEAWHKARELATMWSEDDASCVAERGRCGVAPRGGWRPYENPKGRCKYHAAEEVRCKSALEDDLGARCWNHREDGSNSARNTRTGQTSASRSRTSFASVRASSRPRRISELGRTPASGRPPRVRPNLQLPRLDLQESGGVRL